MPKSQPSGKGRNMPLRRRQALVGAVAVAISIGIVSLIHHKINPSSLLSQNMPRPEFAKRDSPLHGQQAGKLARAEAMKQLNGKEASRQLAEKLGRRIAGEERLRLLKQKSMTLMAKKAEGQMEKFAKQYSQARPVLATRGILTIYPSSVHSWCVTWCRGLFRHI